MHELLPELANQGELSISRKVAFDWLVVVENHVKIERMKEFQVQGKREIVELRFHKYADGAWKVAQLSDIVDDSLQVFLTEPLSG